jgi:DNA polymerase III epsilon subunit-like protein
MSLINVFDTETTDLITDWKKPSEGPDQPHIVSLTGLLVDDQTREIVDSVNVLVKPLNWEISEGAFATHGITRERAMDEGILEEEALEMFTSLNMRATLRIAHNTTFDNRIVRIAQKRYWPEEDPIFAELMRSWKEDKNLYYCTMMQYTKKFGGKWPKLTEAYERLIGRPMEDAHSSLGDAKACMEVYFKLIETE